MVSQNRLKNIQDLITLKRTVPSKNHAYADEVIEQYKNEGIQNIKTAWNLIMKLSGRGTAQINAITKILSLKRPLPVPPMETTTNQNQPKPKPKYELNLDDSDNIDNTTYVSLNTNTRSIFNTDSSDSEEEPITHVVEPIKHYKPKFNINFDDDSDDDDCFIFQSKQEPKQQEQQQEPEPNQEEQQQEPEINKAELLQELITLKEQPSILENITLYELPNIEVLDKLLKSDLIQQEKYNDHVYEHERQHIETYRSIIDHEQKVKVVYKKTLILMVLEGFIV